MSLPRFSVRHPVTITMVILIIVVMGSISVTRLGIDLLPDITYPIISVVTSYEGVASEDIENLITRPIEQAVSTVKNVKNVNAYSQEALSVVMVEFEWGANLDFAAQDLRDRIELISEYMPEDVKKPLVIKFDPSMLPVMVYGVVGQRDMLSLRQLVKDTLRDRLEQLEGIASAMVIGGLDREIMVSVNPHKLETYRIGLNQIIQKLRSENINLPGGRVDQGYNEFLLRTVGELENVDQITNLVISVKNGVPIYLRDLAEVKDTHQEIRSYARINGRDAVLLIINKESGANTVQIVNRVEREIAKLKLRIPKDLELKPVFDQARFIKQVLSTTTSATLVGGILSVLILYFFLRNWRPTITIALAIPLSITCIFIPLFFLGYTLNFITLLGIALGVGMLVDNAIVVIENTFRHLSEGKDRHQAAELGAQEVGMAITASTLTTIVVFLPLIFATGITGRLFRDLALSVTLSLVGSLFVALTIVPMIAAKLFKATEATHGYEVRMIGKWTFLDFQNWYGRIVTWSLNHRKTIVFTMFFALVLSLLMIVFMGKEFFPKMDQNMSMATVKLPVGTKLEETNRIVNMVEKVIIKEPEVEVMSVSFGMSEEQKQDAAFGDRTAGSNAAEIMVRFKDREKRTRTTENILNEVRKKIPAMKNVTFEFMDLGFATMMGGGSQQRRLVIKVFGKDLVYLEHLSHVIINLMRKVKGVYDINSNLEQGKPELKIKVDRDKAALYGLSIGEIATTVQTAMQGKIATRLRQSGDEINVRVKMEKGKTQSIADINNIIITSFIGTQVRLSELAVIQYDRGPITLNRENQKRIVTISANLFGRDLAKATTEIQSLVKSIPLPEGYFLEFGGEYKEMMNMFRDLGLIFILALMLIYMVMAAEFESLAHPLVIMFTVPFSLIGVIMFLLFFGKTLSLPAAMGILILAGVIVNNAIVMIDYVNHLRHTGLDKFNALVQGSATRLRPVLMTTLTTILGLIPSAFGGGQGAEMRSVVAIVLIGGLTVGTILTLVAIPVVYYIFDGWTVSVQNTFRRILHGK